MTTAIRPPRTHRAGLFLTAALGLGLTGFSGIARADPVDLTIIDRDTGQPLQVWRHDGRLFVAGQPGSGYCLRVTNHTARRVEAVLSVDGVNIYTGQTAGYGQGGYVFNPYESYSQCGWRKSLNEIAAFSFTALPDSYAARTGRPAEVGVVGMAVFYEKVEPPAPAAAPSGRVFMGSSGAGAPRDASPPPVMQREVAPPPEPGPPPPPAIMIKPTEKVIVPPPPPLRLAPGALSAVAPSRAAGPEEAGGSPNSTAVRLRAAAAAGRTTEVEALLAQGAVVDGPDEMGDTALMKSVRANHPDVAAALRRGGASLDVKNRAGQSARPPASAIRTRSER